MAALLSTTMHMICAGLHGSRNHLPSLMSLWKTVGKEKMALVHPNKAVGMKLDFMRIKVFSISKGKLWPDVQKAWLSFKGEMFQNTYNQCLENIFSVHGVQSLMRSE